MHTESWCGNLFKVW